MEIYTIVGQDQSCWVYWKIKVLEFQIPPRENKGIFSIPQNDRGKLQT